MKTLLLDLNRTLLVVELPKDSTNIHKSFDWIIWNEKGLCKAKDINIADFDYLCKGGEFSEEILTENKIILDLQNKFSKGFRSDIKTSLEKFRSKIESLGYWWLESPLGELQTCCSGRDCGCIGMPINVRSQSEIDEILDAQSRTFTENCLIFIKK